MIVLVLTALVGATLIVVRGTIFQALQKRLALFRCAQCAGFWIGAATGASGLVQTGHGRVLDALIVGTSSSFLALLADAVLLHLLGDPHEGNGSS
jgi:hypothetical protein